MCSRHLILLHFTIIFLNMPSICRGAEAVSPNTAAATATEAAVADEPAPILRKGHSAHIRPSQIHAIHDLTFGEVLKALFVCNVLQGENVCVLRFFLCGIRWLRCYADPSTLFKIYIFFSISHCFYTAFFSIALPRGERNVLVWQAWTTLWKCADSVYDYLSLRRVVADGDCVSEQQWVALPQCGAGHFDSGVLFLHREDSRYAKVEFCLYVDVDNMSCQPSVNYLIFSVMLFFPYTL